MKIHTTDKGGSMKYLPLFLCLIFFACDTAINDIASNSSTSLGNTLSGSSEGNSSSSFSQPDGYCVPPTLSKDTVYFNEHGGIDTIDIGGAGLFGGRDSEECKYIRVDHYVMEGNIPVKIESDYCKNNYCSNKGAAIYSNSFSAPIMKIECLWYSVAFIDETSLQISVNRNETGERRSLLMDLFAGDCGEVGFTIIQSAGE